MFLDELLEQIFAHEDMQKIPIGTQATAVQVFNDVLENRLEENPYATISELFVPAIGESISE